jgi:WD40 repeat protein
LTDSTLFTEHDQLVGTPEYMSPEQADLANEDVDTRSDIYSLGVVLYQLLTGALPFSSETLREGGVDHVRKVIREQDPKTPSTRLTGLGDEAEAVALKRQTDVTSLARRLHRELEWIPLKAVRKDRTRRYRSAAEFADDIDNYLRGEPLIAGPESMTYRISKFVRRHRAPVAAASVVAVVLLLATVISMVLYGWARNRAEDYRRLLYVNQTALAHSAYRDADVDRARTLLTNCPVDLREFAWSYLWRLCSVVPDTPTILHSDHVNAVAFSPTAEILATASGNMIMLWHTSTHKSQGTLEDHTDTVLSLAFSPDGTMLVSGSKDRTAILWDLASRQQVRVLRGPKETVGTAAVTFSHDGMTISAAFSAGKSSAVMLWDVNTGESVSLPLEGDKLVFSAAFSSDDKMLAVAGRQITTLWDIVSRQKITTIQGDGGHVNSVAFLPDGRILARTGTDGMLRFWDVETREELATINAHTAPIHSLAISPDGAALATASADSTIRLWDTTTYQMTARLRGHTSEVRCVAFSANSTALVSASKDCTAKLWLPAPQPDSDTLIGHNRIVDGVVFTSDSKRVISSGFGFPSVKMWDVVSGRDLSPTLGKPLPGWAACVDLSPDDKILAIGTDGLVLWDMTARRKIGVLSHRNDVGEESANCAVFSPDGKTLATHTYQRTFRLWDVATWRELIRIDGYGSHHSAVAFSPDGNMLAVPKHNNPSITLWETSALRAGQGDSPLTILIGHSEQINAVAFSPNGATLASGSHDTTIRLWDLATKSTTATLTGHTSNVQSLAFSPDGRTLASGGNDGTVRLWNLLLNKQVAVLEGHLSAVWKVAFSPDGQILASTSIDGTLKLWRAATELEIQTQESLH